jgi:quercetin dioxygenase-like cupin family protein
MDKPAASKHIRWDDVPVEHLNPLFDRQFVVGDRVMVARIAMKKGCAVPEHSHHNEQISHILAGSLRFFIEGKQIVLHAGEFLFIPPHVPHAAEALEDSLAIDTFTPPREDWINGTDLYLRK